MSQSERSTFIGALEKDSPEERDTFLNQACGLDDALRQRIQALLLSHARAATFLETTPVHDLARFSRATLAPEGPGTRIGPYKLLQQIGEGGMGVVYMAEQETPVRRKVALKIIKPGMDSDQVVARFEAERQALAMMDHVNIATVLNAGTTDSGRPFFVMELIHGTPITKYCDENQLPLRDRLALFIAVCRAVQHAHQKGVIHRDIKPTNVLVTLYDGQPVPKVIDFGVAKAVETRLTERTLFTHYGVLVGTFEYMAPEQAEMSALGVDTRSDVYSLGVLLYELLTGTTPIDRERMRAAGFAELLRLIREQDPPAPSTRLSSSGEALASISERRKTDPDKLTRLVRGELDWIVMKCLEKDRTRRYDTASGLARDVERYLADEPVAASPTAARYRVRKFARRNKLLLGTTGAVAAALVLGLGAATFGFLRARHDRDRALEAIAAEARHRSAAEQALSAARQSESRAKHEATKAAEISLFLRQMLGTARGDNPNGPDDPTVREALDNAVSKLDEGSLAGQPEVEAAIRTTIGSAYVSLGFHTAAQPQLDAAVALRKATLGDAHPDVATSLLSLGDLAYAKADYHAALERYRQALAIRRNAYGPEHTLVAQAMEEVAKVLSKQGDHDAADAVSAQVLELRRKLQSERTLEFAKSVNARALALFAKKDYAGSEKLFREALDLYRELGGSELHVSRANHNLALILMARKDYAAAPTARTSSSR